jgi:hypothetical protein
MFIVETTSARPARKIAIFMAVVFAITGSFGALFTMHFYVKPSRPAPKGARFLGFPRPARE